MAVLDAPHTGPWHAGVALLVWDFDGTLADRAGRWSDAVLSALGGHLAGHGVGVDALRPHLQSGFPWHTPELAGPAELNPDAWWARLNPVFERALIGTGVHAELAARAALDVRLHSTDPQHWRLYDDSLPTLLALQEQGHRTVLLSNHVPELRALMAHLGLTPLFEAIYNSAETGLEKPHPEAFRQIERAYPGARFCMIGDNPVADLAGARAVGWDAVQIRASDTDDLSHLTALLGTPAD